MTKKPMYDLGQRKKKRSTNPTYLVFVARQKMVMLVIALFVLLAFLDSTYICKFLLTRTLIIRHNRAQVRALTQNHSAAFHWIQISATFCPQQSEQK